MTDAETKAADGETKKYNIAEDPDEPTLEDLTSPDLTLNDVLDVFFGTGEEADDVEIPLTLVVQGLVVSGTAISRPAWVRGLTESGGETEGTVTHALRLRWEQDQVDSVAMRDRRIEAGLPSLTRKFVHLKDASLMPSGGNGRVVAPYFRARLSEIGGWTLGAATFNE
ncbi:hypothetical protein [Microbacterium sp. ABRD28]|uniref:hypothetical protein n=1 Tax=Microbacterium sp. ABRD28 TaxID=2268461 RepID=UPI0013DDE414|nr:hypothetical protein [Microbacterium sp. ABRD28]